MSDEARHAIVREGAKLLGALFIHRRDAKAVFVNDRTGPHWASVKSKFSLSDFENHFLHDRCLGTYLLNTDSTVKFVAFDVDLKSNGQYFKVHDVEQINALESEGYYDGEIELDLRVGDLEAALHDPTHEAHRWACIILLGALRDLRSAVTDQLGLPSLVVVTGGGGHVLVPLGEPVPAAEARAAAVAVVAGLALTRQKGNGEVFWNYGTGDVPSVEIEVFPKQDSLDGKSFGNLIRLPFGLHQETGVRTFAIDADKRQAPSWSWQRISSIKALRSLADQVGVA